MEDIRISGRCRDKSLFRLSGNRRDQAGTLSGSLEHMRTSTNVDAMTDTFVMTGDTAILRH